MTRRSLRILLLEDDPEDAILFQKHCRARLTIHHVTTTAQAMAALQEGRFDACFVDYQLGAESGLDFVRAARGRGIGLPLIVVTGLQIEVLGENALLAGATDFITKEELDGDTIERTLRWALIRRHVEVRRDDLANASIVSSLMGREPAAVLDPSRAKALRRVLYVSVATRAFTGAELLPMCSKFAAANARLGVTGALAYAGERFFQAIEGPAEAVEVLLRRIEADPRHGQMHVVLEEPAGRRLFDEWNMGLLRAPGPVTGPAPRNEPSEIAARIRTGLAGSTSRKAIEEVLLSFPGCG
jgi:CheY-like chemotaxis protein